MELRESQSVAHAVLIVIAGRGADIAAIGARVREVLAGRQRQLPAGAELVVVYDRSRSYLAARVEQTLLRALVEEIAAVAIMSLLLLAHGRSALVPAITLPAVVLLTLAPLKNPVVATATEVTAAWGDRPRFFRSPRWLSSSRFWRGDTSPTLCRRSERASPPVEARDCSWESCVPGPFCHGA